MYPYPLGVRVFEEKYKDSKNGIQVSFASKEETCGIVFFDRKTGEEVARYAFSAEKKIGNVYTETITGLEVRKLTYLFYEGNKLIADKHAIRFIGKDEFGIQKGVEAYKAVISDEAYDWEEDKLPRIPYEDCVVYCMHVRGFTKHSSSGVKAKGTFAGIVEKIPYLKELGITTLELQPAYEFNELPQVEQFEKKTLMKAVEPGLNYWGYTEGFYYTPKRSYAKGENACKEFKDMVKALHENDMEVVMQFYFPQTVTVAEILEVLQFWRVVYHVDGFHVKGSNLQVKELAQNPYLADCKLWYYEFPVAQLYPNGQKPQWRNLAFYNDDYLKAVRRFLKGDEGLLYEVMLRMRSNPSTHGMINYITNYDGFTLADMVSYERKHNEANGEENRDGNDYNFSWNWGEEGPTRKKLVQDLRKKLQRNAFTILMLSQGTPLFFMGDEFGNSQGGNNNPYCQDNEVTWLNWKDLNKNKELYDYVKTLIVFRKEHGVFHQPKECRMVDYLSVGCPDLSYHGKEAWLQKWEHYNRHVGVMLCGEYIKGCEGKYYYVAINMYWEEQEFILPKLPGERKWSFVFSTEVVPLQQPEEGAECAYKVQPRSIAVFVGSK